MRRALCRPARLGAQLRDARHGRRLPISQRPAPPATLPAAMRMAAEHLAFRPDNVDGSVHELAEYAKRLTSARSWTFS
ncbi:DUF4253 domain-containing protein [Kitasatospora sp. NPDC004669]|uniref:DUF4253 domain-containing protein n=1 Tax=Kitasatospora sp. NPDC004669 TaxID=3154555 RepID=UPI0033A79C64